MFVIRSHFAKSQFSVICEGGAFFLPFEQKRNRFADVRREMHAIVLKNPKIGYRNMSSCRLLRMIRSFSSGFSDFMEVFLIGT